MDMRALRALFLPMAHVCLFLHKIYLVVGIFYGLPTLHVLYAIAYGFAILNVVGIPGTTHLYPENGLPYCLVSFHMGFAPMDVYLDCTNIPVDA